MTNEQNLPEQLLLSGKTFSKLNFSCWGWLLGNIWPNFLLFLLCRSHILRLSLRWQNRRWNKTRPSWWWGKNCSTKMYKVGPWNCRFDAWKCMFVTVCVCVCFFTCFWGVIIKVHSLQHQRKGFLWRNSRENTGQTFSTNIYSSLKCHKPVVVWPDLSNSKNVHVLMSMWNFPSSTTTSPQRAHWNMSLWRLQQISDACDQPINHQPGLQIRFPSKTLQSFFFFCCSCFITFFNPPSHEDEDSPDRLHECAVTS